MPDWLPFALLALVCPIGMGMMMLFMRGSHAGHGHASRPGVSGDSAIEIARLEKEKAALELEMEKLRSKAKGG